MPRKWPRFKRRLTLEYNVDHISWQRGWRGGFTTDAGPRGLCVSSPFVPARGTKLRLNVELPGTGQVEMWGTVVWDDHTTLSSPRAPSSFGVALTCAPEAWFQFWRDV